MPNKPVRPIAGSNVYIASLPGTYTDQMLHDLLSPFGPITSARVMCDPRTGQCKGYGFVLFDSDRSAMAAVQGLLGHVIEGHRIQVRLAHLAASPLVNRPETSEKNTMHVTPPADPMATQWQSVPSGSTYYLNVPAVQYQVLPMATQSTIPTMNTPLFAQIPGGFQTVPSPSFSIQQSNQPVFVLSASLVDFSANQVPNFYSTAIDHHPQQATFLPY